MDHIPNNNNNNNHSTNTGVTRATSDISNNSSIQTNSNNSSTDDTEASGSVEPAAIDEGAKHRRFVLRRELTKMKEKDENEKLRKQAKRAALEKAAKKKIGIDRLERGFTILPGAKESKRDITADIKLEERLSLKDKQEKLRSESQKMQHDIDKKFGITDLPKGKELVDMATEFYSNQRMPNEHLPPNVTKALTTEEINDFRMVFDLFDVKNKGYITSDDLKRVAAMFGFTAKKRVFNEMIDSVTTNKRGRITFISFLELIVKLQGDGPDQLEEIKKGFSLLDKGEKGYLTFSDVREASDDLKVNLSNRAIREMMTEADLTGDGTVDMEEFKNILLQTGTFRSMPGPL